MLWLLTEPTMRNANGKRKFKSKKKATFWISLGNYKLKFTYGNEIENNI